MKWLILVLAVLFVVGVIDTMIKERSNPDTDNGAKKASPPKPSPRRRKNELQPPTEAEIILRFSPDNGISVSSAVNEPEKSSSPSRYDRPDEELWNGARKVTIEYKDSKGSFTTREVKMTSVFCNQYGELCMRGRCSLRDSTRTFKGDRIRVITTARGQQYLDFVEYLTEELHV